MKFIIQILALVVFIAAQGEALDCYQCSSYTDSHCADPFFFENDDGTKVPKTPTFLQPCPARDDGKEYTMCRKIFQNVRGEERVIRTCGYEEYKNEQECYTTVLEEYNTYVCGCKEDGCNGAETLRSSFAILPILVAMLSTKFLF